MNLKVIPCDVYLMGKYMGRAEQIKMRHPDPLSEYRPRYYMTVYVDGLQIHPHSHQLESRTDIHILRIEKATIEWVAKDE